MKRRGTGVGCMFYGVGNTGLPNPAAAFVQVLPDTSVHVTVGAADIGQGSSTMAASVAAETLGLDYENIQVSWADTMFAPEGGATSASRQTFITGNAVKNACETAMGELKRTASEELNVPEEEKHLQTEAELRAELVTFTAGRAAEEIVFGSVTTGAANDIEKATKIARSMITRFGMSEKFGMVGLESVAGEYLDNRLVLNCSEVTEAEVDKEVMKLIKESYEKAKKLLQEHKDTMDKIAAFLIEKETITGKQFMEIFHQEEGKVGLDKEAAAES